MSRVFLNRQLLATAEFAGQALQSFWETGSPAAAFQATSRSYVPDFTRCIDHFALHAGKQKQQQILCLSGRRALDT
jgi:hypothetical protein